MRLRCAVPKIPTGSSVLLGLPFYNSPVFLKHSESALGEVLIPLHFNSSTISVYKKAGEGIALSRTKVLQLVTSHESPRWSRRIRHNPNSIKHFRTLSVTYGVYPLSQRTFRKRPAVRPKLFPRFPQPKLCAHAENSATQFLSCAYLITCGHPGGGGLSRHSQPRLSSLRNLVLRVLCVSASSLLLIRSRRTRQNLVQQLPHRPMRLQDRITMVHRPRQIRIRESDSPKWRTAQNVTRRRLAISTKEKSRLRIEIRVAPSIQNNRLRCHAPRQTPRHQTSPRTAAGCAARTRGTTW